MQQNEQKQPHVIYHVYNGGGPPPAPPPAPAAVPVMNPMEQIERRLREMRERDEQKLHEATAATKQSVNQKMLEIEGEVKRAADLARAASAAASSTDDIRKNRGTQAFNEQLQAELRSVKETARNENAMLRSQLATMEQDKKAFFEQQLENELERARRAKKRNDTLTATSSTSGPPPPPPPPATG